MRASYISKFGHVDTYCSHLLIFSQGARESNRSSLVYIISVFSVPVHTSPFTPYITADLDVGYDAGGIG